jgi:hypothetical protein
MPTMSTLSVFESLAPEILGCVAFHLLLADSFLGPLNDLVPLLLSSRVIFDAISFENNAPLYADLFLCKFDYAALKRRFSDRWRTAQCLASELKKRLSLLKRIRHRTTLPDSPDFVDDLWTAYIMMQESDGRNESQLIEWACIPGYLYRVFYLCVRATPGASWGWYSDSEATSLIVWLLFMTVGAGMSLFNLRSEISVSHPQTAR